jgi:hypothetical protein
MILGNIEGLKVMVVVLNVRTTSDLEAHTPKTSMISSIISVSGWTLPAPNASREGDVNPLVFERLDSRLLFDLPETFFDLFLEQFSQAIELLAGLRALFRRQIFQAPQHRSQSTAPTQSLNANLFDLRLGVAMMNSLQHLLLESF